MLSRPRCACRPGATDAPARPSPSRCSVWRRDSSPPMLSRSASCIGTASTSPRTSRPTAGWSSAETQTIVFTGDWNGGERRFNIRPRQHLLVTGVYREGPGGLGAADAGLRPRRRRRLRVGRRRDDSVAQPPALRSAVCGHRHPLSRFDYELSGILLKDGDQYRLDHDFAFPDRAGVIVRVRAAPDLRSRVAAADGACGRVYTAGPLAAGAELRARHPARASPARSRRRPATLRRPREMVVGRVGDPRSAPSSACRGFFAREHRLGRFAPLDAPRSTRRGSREHIFKYPAEVVAAAWDENVGTAEVVVAHRPHGRRRQAAKLGRQGSAKTAVDDAAADRRSVDAAAGTSARSSTSCSSATAR